MLSFFCFSVLLTMFKGNKVCLPAPVKLPSYHVTSALSNPRVPFSPSAQMRENVSIVSFLFKKSFAYFWMIVQMNVYFSTNMYSKRLLL